MTKISQIKEEEQIMQRFLAHLKHKNKNLKSHYEKTESPDFRVQLGERIIGCELTRITLNELEEWARGYSEKEDKIHQEVVELKSDKWMNDLLRRKTEKTKAYRQNCECDELWLIVHFGIVPLFGHGPESFEKMKKAIQGWKHDFDKIWFVGEEGDIRQLWPEEIK